MGHLLGDSLHRDRKGTSKLKKRTLNSPLPVRCNRAGGTSDFLHICARLICEQPGSSNASYGIHR